MALLNQTPQQYYEGDDHGSYQHISLADIINNFIISYVGDDKIINTVKRSEVAFHAQRALQELSYDTLKSVKSIEVEVGPSLSVPLPQDYVNYVKVAWTDEAGIEQLVMPNRMSSTPTAILQDHDYKYLFDSSGNLILANKSETEKRWHDATVLPNESGSTSDNFLDEGFTDDLNSGKRFGIMPEFTTKNGAFYIDQANGRMSFTSDFVGRILVLQYISDGLATEEEMRVHKFAEEAVYKYIACAIVSNKFDAPEYRVARLKKERRAAIRNAKIRLNSLKIQELTQIMRNKAKQIK